VIARELTVHNYVPPPPPTDVVSREFTAYNYLPPPPPTDVVSREFTILREQLGQAKRRPDGSYIRLLGSDGLGVSAVFADCVYVEMPDRSAAIKVIGGTAQEGHRVNVEGALATDDANGERYIQAASVVSVGSLPIAPLNMVVRSAYCGPFEHDPITGAGQRGVTDGSGLNLVAILLRVAGKVTTAGGSAFSLDDGSVETLKVLVPDGAECPSANSHVVVTGVLTLEKQAETVVPVLRPRRADDIAAVGP